MGSPHAIWRPWPDAPVLVMAGPTQGYRVEPNGETVLGHVDRGAMAVLRGRRRFLFGAGDSCAWDSSGVHEGSPYRCQTWDARVIVLEAPALADQLRDLELAPRVIEIARPVVEDRQLSARFLALHRGLSERDAPRLAHETMLAEYIELLLARNGIAAPASKARRDPALRRACEYLVANADRNFRLEELAAAAGAPRFRVLRLFGAPPHRFQIAQRILRARRLLEPGDTPSDVAMATGFADQAHMHRHFVRTLGITPKRYARAFVR